MSDRYLKEPTNTELEIATRMQKKVVTVLRSETDRERAQQQQAYMKSEMPYFGLSVPRCRRIAHEELSDLPPQNSDVWATSILLLWRDATHREERYVAIELFLNKKFAHWLVPDQLPVLEELVVTGAWWDYVDALATRGAGTMLVNESVQTKRILYKWAKDQNIWKRRVAILAQLKSKTNTDVELLSKCIEPSIGHSEFFLRKGIGWALREYSKTDPDWVKEFVEKHPDLSDLSRREALKHITRA
ncbi:MAG: DNA alkylation repair protein [Gammaproteobacteria bacterium]|nr:DNA alkylation repair protein [Gammaproteobacteria bacterium]